MSRSELWSGLGTAFVIIAVGGFMTCSDARKRETVANEIASKPAAEHNLAVFDAATGLLRTHYYDSEYFTTPEWRRLESRWRTRAAGAEPEDLYADVLDGLAEEFPDSHLAFAMPQQEVGDDSEPKFEAEPPDAPDQMLERLRSSPGFESVTIRRGRDRPRIIDEVMRDSPAERAGITPGWMVLNDSTDITDERARCSAEFLELDDGISRSLERTGSLPWGESTDEYQAFVAAHTVKVELELEPLAAPTNFETRVLAGGFTYLRFDFFEAMEVVEKAVAVIDSAGPEGLVLDLRHNPGGRLLQLQRVAGGLLGDDVQLGTNRVANKSEPMWTWRFRNHYRGPLVVLIGPSTASAAEILAGAVQDHRRGQLIGRPTNGSVVPGEWFGLPDGGSMMIPVSDFVRSDGRRIEGAGVLPDIWILPTLEDVRSGRDPVLERALRELNAEQRTTSQ